MPAVKKMNYLRNLKVPWGPGGRSKKRKQVEQEQEKENASQIFLRVKLL
jgi:hypothetical protein